MRISQATRCAGWTILLAIVGASYVTPPAPPATGAATTQPADAASATQPVPVTGPGVTLHLTDKPRDQILADFARVAHVSFAEPAPGFWTWEKWSSPTMSFDIQDQPFWTALSRLQDAMGIGFVSDPNGDHIAPTHERGDWGWTGHPESACGPVLLSVRQINRRTTVPLEDASRASDQLTILVHACVQPGTDWTLDQDCMEMTSCRTDEDVELVPHDQPLRLRSQPVRSQGQYPFSTFVPVGSQIGWVTLRGSCRCFGSTRDQTIEIADAENTPLDRQVAGFAIHLATTRNARNIEVRIACPVPAGTDRRSVFAFRNRLNGILEGRMKMFDANGIEMIARPGFDRPAFRRRPTTSMPAIDHVDLLTDFSPADAPPPFRIVWTVPVELKEITFPILIKEIPVP